MFFTALSITPVTVLHIKMPVAREKTSMNYWIVKSSVMQPSCHRRVCFIRWVCRLYCISYILLYSGDALQMYCQHIAWHRQSWCNQCGQWYFSYTTGHDLAFWKQIWGPWILEIMGMWEGGHANTRLDLLGPCQYSKSWEYWSLLLGPCLVACNW